MKRNVLKTIALTVCLIMAAAFGVACGGNGTGANNSSNGGNGGASTPNMETCAHSFTNYQSNGDATCTANGTKTAVCDNGCGAEDTVTDTGSMLQHSFENGVCGGCGEKEYTEGLQFALASNKKGYAVTGYTGTDKEVYIPSTYDGMPVTEIGEWAFYDKGITKVVIREGVERVLKGAFGSCKQLKSISIPSTVYVFFDYAFVYCYELKEVHITDLAAWCEVYGQSNNYANPLSMGHNLYLNGELVTELTIPEEASYIGSCAFQNCLSLTKVVIPNHVYNVSDFAFYDCTNLQSVTLEGGGEGELILGNYAFGSCHGLTSIIIPAEVWGIEQASFNNCTNLTIYCEAESKPSTWNWVWEISGMPVYWYSENEPQHNSEGTGYWLGLNHWRYDENGGIFIWEFGKQYNPAQ